ncbi:LysR substrate-binding domain-containing protein [Falsiroseomonas selenitidurans]|uniref:LysR family transcriptional regulator n=1 Tax=Falsiroseomonas selenitidurans TaxID=2716335 RepID=A0ABX1EG11_9PROT|nr:LysR substrate-binding domain-containing protein [Falsiroseomonas selenitidurans]NKC34462.1 LysR family transcriptional regulator [Falsiroseomonas selenitidurans]
MADPPRARPSLRMIEAFEALARLGSRSAASAELNVTPGAISKHLRALERWIGQPLFAEEGRDMILNPAGRALAQSVTAGLAQIDDGLQALRPAEPERTQLSVLAPASFAMKWLVPRLYRLERVAPQLQVTLRQTNTDDDWLKLPHHVAIRRDGFVPAGYEAQPLLRETLAAYAAPALARAATVPEALTLLESQTRSGDLDRWLVAAMAAPRDGTRRDQLRLGQPRRRFAHFYIAYEAALAGEGLVVAPTLVASADVAAGRLAVLWPEIRVPGAAYSVVLPNAAALRGRAAPFLGWLQAEIEGCGTAPALPGPPAGAG